MSKPLVSIGLPTFNRPRTLERTLKSLVNQTYTNIEIVVSDNCSTNPEVEDVIKRYIGDSRIRYFRQAQNKGAIFNFNFVLEQFTGEYFLRLGDDDWLDSNYIESCVNFLIENSDFVCAYGKPCLFDLDGKFVKNDNEIDLIEDGFTERMIKYYKNVAQNGLYFGVMRIECLPNVRSNERLADDWFGMARICFMGKVKMLENTNLNISQGGTGSTLEGIIQVIGSGPFVRCFPYFSISIDAFRDILWKGDLYKGINFTKRVGLANKCARILAHRFNVKKEIKGSYKLYFKSILSNRASRA